MRDWAKTLLSASFRGVPFFVEGDELSGGRRAAIHEFAGGEVSTIEDQGRRTRLVDLTVYVLGDVADARAHALTSALDMPGAGQMVLPIDGLLSVQILEWRRSRERDRAGYIAFGISGAVAAAGIVSGLSLGDVAAAYGAPSAVAGAVAAFGGLF